MASELLILFSIFSQMCSWPIGLTKVLSNIFYVLLFSLQLYLNKISRVHPLQIMLMSGNGNCTCYFVMMMNKRLSQGKERIGEILNNLPNWLIECVCTGISLPLADSDTAQYLHYNLTIVYILPAVSILKLLCSVRFHCLIIDQILMTKDPKER